MDFDAGRRRLLASASAAAALAGTGGCALRGALSSPPAPDRASPTPGAPAGAGRASSVLVVGGGLAGLAAANALVELGHEVRVLEAKERVGGRILTVRDPWRDGLFVEAGAAHVVGDPDLLKLLAAMNVAVEKRPRARGLAQVSFIAGKRVVLPADARPPAERLLRADEEAMGEEGRMSRYFAEAKTFDPTAPFPAALLALDELTGAAFLRRQGASPAFIAGIDSMLGLGDAGVEGMSALSLVQQWAEIRREIALGGGGRVVGGADRLPAAIAARLGARVITGAVVTHVAPATRSVRVAFLHRGVERVIDVDRLVLAIPPKVLARMPVTPALSSEKRRALAEIELESVTRVWLQADQRFWTLRGESARARTDLPIGVVRDEIEGLAGTAGIVGVYATRAESRRLTAMTPDDRLLTVMTDLERVHPGMREHFAGGASKSWDDDPFQRGAYATFKPGQLTRLAPHLGRAEGRLHFAGDHTSHRPGFMHGALASARRVVAELTAS